MVHLNWCGHLFLILILILVLASSSRLSLGGLTRLVQDDKVKSMISGVVGHDTTAIIDETVTVIQARSSFEAKHDALLKGVSKIQSNLKTNGVQDPALKLFMNVIGMNRNA